VITGPRGCFLTTVSRNLLDIDTSHIYIRFNSLQWKALSTKMTPCLLKGAKP
jgi:hypothetical protein